MAISTGEGYSLLGQGFAQAAQGNLSEQRKLMKEAQRRQLMTAALTPIAQGVGQFATDLISAPFKDPAKRFMTTDYGQKLKRAKRLRRTDQSVLAAEAKRISDSGMGGINLYTKEAEEKVIAGFKKTLGSDYTGNEEFYSSQVTEQAAVNAEKRYKAYQDAVSKTNRVFSDTEWEDAITKYGSESPNAAVSLWRGAKRLVGVGKSNEEYRKAAFDNVVDTMELDSYLDEKDPSFIELKKQISIGMRPFSSTDIVKQIGNNNKDNPIFQVAVKTAADAKRDYLMFSENVPDLMADAISTEGTVRKGLASVRLQIKTNAKLPDASNAAQQKFYVASYMADANLAEGKIASFEKDLHSRLANEDYNNISTGTLAENQEAVDKQLKSALTGVYAEATRLTGVQLLKLKQTDINQYNKNFADSATSELHRDALILNNMDKIMEYSLEEKEQILTKGFDSVASLQTGRILKEEFDPFYTKYLPDAEQADGQRPVDDLKVDDNTMPGTDGVDLKTDSVAVPTVPTVSTGSLDKMKSMYDSGSTAQAFEMGRNAIRQDVKNQQSKGNFKTAKDAVDFGLRMSSRIGKEAGMPDLVFSSLDVPMITGDLFAANGSSVDVDLKDLRQRYNVSKGSTGQINIESSSGHSSLRISDIPKGEIKNHLTYLQIQYQQNMEELNSLGVGGASRQQSPESRGLTNIGGRGRELKLRNNKILDAIDLPGLNDRDKVIEFLTAEKAPDLGYYIDRKSTLNRPKEERSTQPSLLSNPSETNKAELSFNEPEVSVVEAAAAEVSELFNDGSAATALLRETAIQESNMGQTKGTYTMSDGSGKFGRGSFGVSQVDERTFNDTLSRLRGDKGQPRNLVKYVDIMKDKAGIDLTEVTYEDLADPKLSLIFSRLHYLKIADPIPPTTAERAKYWKKHYNTSAGAGSPKEYLDNQRSYEVKYGA
jgi:hypothetical protein